MASLASTIDEARPLQISNKLLIFGGMATHQATADGLSAISRCEWHGCQPSRRRDFDTTRAWRMVSGAVHRFDPYPRV